MKAEGFTIDNSQLAAQRYHTFRSLHPLTLSLPSPKRGGNSRGGGVD